MIEVNIPKDLDRYEAKFVGPFTVRQTVSIVCALPVGILLFNVTKDSLGVDVAGFICLLPAVVAYLFGWYKPYGMKFEVFLRSVFVTTVLAPPKRKYKTENFYKILMSSKFEEEEDDFLLSDDKKKRKKKSKRKSSSENNYVPSPKAIQ